MNFNIKRHTRQLLLAMGAFGIVLAASSPALSTAPSYLQAARDIRFKPTHTPPESKQEQATTDDFDSYKSEQFTVLYPKTWQATPEGSNSVAISSPTVGAIEPIRTEIKLLREDPNTVVPQTLDQLSAEGASIQRYSLVSVDNQSGFRIWYNAETDQQSLMTFVGYGDQQTAILTSHYNANDPNTEAIVTALHNSFTNHSVAQAITP